MKKRLRRAEVRDFFAGLAPCSIGMEGCASSHYWARELAAVGHEVRLMPPSHVKPYVERQKNDAADAEAICDAVTRPDMRFVPVKSEDQQAVLMLHRTRDPLIRQRTALTNALRAHLVELGIIARRGVAGLDTLIVSVEKEVDIPALARRALGLLVKELTSMKEQIKAVEAEIMAWHRSNEASRRLATIPGIGPIIASARAATISDPSVFEPGRQLAAWIGLVPRQNASGGKERLGHITEQGEPCLRRLLVIEASLRRLASAIKARRVCEQAHQRVQEEPGLDQFEGGSWMGLHRHAPMTMLAHAFLQHRRLAAAGREKS